MSRMSAQELRAKIGQGLLSFPVTHFDQQFEFEEKGYREHIAWLLEHRPAGLFAAGGTGEFFSLALDEFAGVISAAVTETAGKVPVLAGCGYGTSMAKQFAKAAEDAGADGILLLPPYLVNAEPAGLVAHAVAVCSSTRLGVIFYNRDNAILNEVQLERLCDRARHMSLMTVGFVAVLPALCGCVGGVLGGVVSDGLLRAGYSLTFARKTPIVTGMLLAMAMIACNYTHTQWLIVLWMALAFFGKGFGALGWTVISDTSPKGMVGVNGGLFNLIGNLAGVTTQIVIGYIVKRTGSFNDALLFVGLTALMAIVAYLPIVGTIQRVEFTSGTESGIVA
jgi:hypothetical protein